jgi:hypothetical protein
VTAFSANGYIEESIYFGNQALTYALQKNSFNNLSAIFENNKITLFMPEAMVNEWALTEKVGFEYWHAELFLLVEKDFKCLDDVAEDQSDNYPNPLIKI